jgi:hypothetical protein
MKNKRAYQQDVRRRAAANRFRKAAEPVLNAISDRVRNESELRWNQILEQLQRCNSKHE